MRSDWDVASEMKGYHHRLRKPNRCVHDGTDMRMTCALRSAKEGKFSAALNMTPLDKSTETALCKKVWRNHNTKPNPKQTEFTGIKHTWPCRIVTENQSKHDWAMQLSLFPTMTPKSHDQIPICNHFKMPWRENGNVSRNLGSLVTRCWFTYSQDAKTSQTARVPWLGPTVNSENWLLQVDLWPPHSHAKTHRHRQ